MSQTDIHYSAGPTMSAFHSDDAFWRVVIGPVRSGKTVGMCAEIMRRCMAQEPDLHDGIRRSRVVCVRNTYRELEDSTVKTWDAWYGSSQFGHMNKNSMTFFLKFNDVEAEILFRALDRPDDVKRLLGTEYGFAWFNEAREIPKRLMDVVGDRAGNYPRRINDKHGNRIYGCTWSGVMMDTNPPDDDHWMYRFAEEEKPEGWSFYRQPGALLEVDGKFLPNPEAENVNNLNDGIDYYLKRISGKKLDHIRVYYCGEWGYVQEGRPVHEEYVDATHCSEEILVPTKKLALSLGIDFGLTPAMVLGQKQVNGQWLILDEFVTERSGIAQFCDNVLPILRKDYAGFEFNTAWGDPAGTQQAQTDEQNVFDILNAKGLVAERAYHNNDPVLRRESLQRPLTRLIDGKPGFLLSPKCKTLRKALKGGYCYKRVQVGGDEARFMDKPDKNKYSHIAEALEYMMLGEGEGDAVLMGHTPIVLPEKELIRSRLRTNIYSQSSWML